MAGKSSAKKGGNPGEKAPSLSQPAHCLPAGEVLAQLQSDPVNGLRDDEVSKNQGIYGSNALEGGGGSGPIRILMNQVLNALTMVLIMAMVASFAIKSWIEGGVIAFVVLLNVVVGFLQEYSAEKTLESIRTLGSPTAQVIRMGSSKVILTSQLVPGDIVEIVTGNTVPADLRLIESINLETDEALLTGESLPVAKNADSIFDADTGAGDRLNVAYSSSTVTKGRAKAVVVSIGMETEIGKIAAALRHKDSVIQPVKRRADGSAGPIQYLQAWILTAWTLLGNFLGTNVGTPLQRKLSKLAILLFGIACLCAFIVEAANQFSPANEVVIYGVATGLSMIPASLIVVLTITMAVGTKYMSKRNVIVRKLDSLEALGAVTNICSDKTGTLTQGRMVAKAAWVAGRGTLTLDNPKDPYDPTMGAITYFNGAPESSHIASEKDQKILNPEELSSGRATKEHVSIEDFMNVVSMANTAQVERSAQGNWSVKGDPTEIALQVFASRFNWNRKRLVDETNEWRLAAEYPFDSDVKRMSVIYSKKTEAGEEESWVFSKGAVERLLPLCTHYQGGDGDSAVEMGPEWNAVIMKNVDYLANQGLRVLCLASVLRTGSQKGANVAELKREDVEQGLTFRGLVGIYDPPRPESAGAVAACKRAHITVHMLTGDHPGTAAAIAKQVGIIPFNPQPSSVMTASQFDKLTDDQVDALTSLPRVIARCTPQTKVRMIDALHRRKRFAAMTGDGVNDSPSLVRADVGIAMGQAGSDVAKDASDIILTDDNFASILNAVEEGRRLFDNIKRFVLHVLAENIAQATTLLVGLAFKDANGNSVFPLAPVQILWVIMATSGMPDMGLGMEVAVPDIMSRPPHDLKTGVFTTELIVDMIVYGIWMSILCLASFVLVVFGFGDGNLGFNCNNEYSDSCNLVFRARATTFVCLTWFALFLAWEMVNFRRSFFRQVPKSMHPSGNYRWFHVFYQWWDDSRQNPFLFWAIVAGFVTIFPTLYIPVINHVVFKHEGITWEWAIVVVESILFFAGCEGWKWLKRAYFRRQDRKKPASADLDEESVSDSDSFVNRSIHSDGREKSAARTDGGVIAVGQLD